MPKNYNHKGDQVTRGQKSTFEIRQQETEKFYEKEKLFILEREKNNRGIPRRNSNANHNLSVDLFT